MKLSELAQAVRIDVARDGDFQSLGLLTARAPATLACLHDPARAGEWTSSSALSCVITAPDLADLVPEHLGLGIATAPREAFLDAQRYLGGETDFYGPDIASEISPDARVHASAHVAQRNVMIAAGCTVEAGAVILPGVTLAEGAMVRSGAVVGAEGYHPIPYGDGILNMPHHGSVRVGRRADIGSNSVVCRSVFANATEIGEDTVLGPLVYVAHGVRVGSACRIAASARICGSSVIGDRVIIGPNSVISNLISVGDGARVTIGAVVTRDVPAGQTVTGHFAIEHRRFMEIWKRLFR